MYSKIVEEFTNNPRDIHTVPIKRKSYKLFYVFADNGHLYIEPSHNNSPKCMVKIRMLHEKECNKMLEIYHRRLFGEEISKEAQNCTYSQVY